MGVDPPTSNPYAPAAPTSGTAKASLTSSTRSAGSTAFQERRHEVGTLIAACVLGGAVVEAQALVLPDLPGPEVAEQLAGVLLPPAAG